MEIVSTTDYINQLWLLSSLRVTSRLAENVLYVNMWLGLNVKFSYCFLQNYLCGSRKRSSTELPVTVIGTKIKDTKKWMTYDGKLR